MRHKECPKCGTDISDSYQPSDDDVGIRAGWYCDACDLAIGGDDRDDDFE